MRHAAAGRVPFELLVIDDASPEQPLRDYVERFGAQPAPVPVTVLHNDENLGLRPHRQPRHAARARRRRRAELRHRGDRRLARPARRRRRAPRRRDGHAADESRLAVHAACRGHRRVRARGRRPAHRRVRDVRRRAVVAAASRGDQRRRVLHVRDAPRARPVRPVRRGHVRASATARRSTSACARRASGCGTSSRTRRSCTTAAACRSATSRARDGAAARRSSTRAIRSSGRPTRANASSTRLAVPFAALELALIERDRRRPHVLHVTHSPLEAMGGTEKYVAALLESARRRLRLLRAVPRRLRLRAARVLGGRRATGRTGVPAPGRGVAGDAYGRPGHCVRDRDRARPVRFRRGARAQPDRLLARAVRRARRIRRCRWCAPCTTCSSRARTSRCST